MSSTRLIPNATDRWTAVGLAMLASLAIAACRDASAPSGPTPVARLVILSEPVDGLAGLTLLPIVVTARDADDRVASAYTGPVTIALGPRTGSGTLSGVTTVGAVGGVATFTTLRISAAGAGYTLVATADGLTAGASAPFRVSPPGARIAFVAPDPLQSTDGIYLLAADGSGLGVLTRGPGRYGRPAWSPDATRIAFVRDSSVFMINADGSGLVKVAAGAFDPTWSADGAKIRFTKSISTPSSQTEIDEVTVDGTLVTRIAAWPLKFYSPDGGRQDLKIGEDFGDRLEWSPDRSRVAFEWFSWYTPQPIGCDDYCDTGVTLVYVMNADGSGMRRLTASPGLHPTWSADGKRIAFLATPGAGLATVSSDGAGLLTTVVDQSAVSSIVIDNPTWSQGANQIAFVGAPSVQSVSGPDIWIVDVAGTGIPRRLTSFRLGVIWPYGGRASIKDLAWSPR